MKIRPVFWVAVLLCLSVVILSKFLTREPREILRTQKNHQGILVSSLTPLRQKLIQKIDQRIPSPSNAIAKAILLGDQSGLTRSVRDTFSKSGTAHLLAISGAHMGLIAICAVALVRLIYLPRRVGYGIVISMIIFYCLLVGARPSIVRATIMISIFMIGFMVKRQPEIITSLSWAAIAILFYDPLQIFSLGFQLSFLSVFMIAAICGQWDDVQVNLKSNVLKKTLVYLNRALSVSLAAWIGVVPFIAHSFSLITPITIIANLFLVPYFGILQVSGFMFLILGSLHSSLSEILGHALTLLCLGAVRLSDFFVAIPFSHFRVRSPGPLEIALFYVLILGGVVWINKRHEKTR